MNILFFGPNGSGKGTQGAILKKKYDLPHIESGAIFRENIKGGTELGAKFMKFSYAFFFFLSASSRSVGTASLVLISRARGAILPFFLTALNSTKPCSVINPCVIIFRARLILA